jgi:cell shape-determining protein MreC
MTTPRRHLVVALVLAVLTAALVASGGARRVWQWLAPLAIPWQADLSSRRPQGEELVGLQERVIRLNVENVVLRRRLAEYQQIEGEGHLPPAQAVAARGRIIARTERQGRRFCELDVGAVDGVERDMPVILGWTLIGSVAGLQPGRCVVRQISDIDSRVPAGLYDDHELLAEGVLRGTGEAGEASLDLVEDRPGLTVEAGQHVVTAGLGGFPPGLALGPVIEAQRGGAADHWKIRVRLLRTAERAESLLVIHEAAETRPPPMPAGAVPPVSGEAAPKR